MNLYRIAANYNGTLEAFYTHIDLDRHDLFDRGAASQYSLDSMNSLCQGSVMKIWLQMSAVRFVHTQ